MRRLTSLLAMAALAAACQTGAQAPMKKSAAPLKPAIAQRPPATGNMRVTGVVRLISVNGAAIVSNNGGTIIANNGGTIIANNGGGYRVLAKEPEALLADADVTVTDAAGKAVRGPDGKPLVARTDKQGRFALMAGRETGNLVLKVKLWTGGELQALLVRDPAESQTQDVGTATSLGAAFVLERLVKGDQVLLDKVPATEAGRLQRELEAARDLLAAPPVYDPAELAAAADQLRGKAPSVNAAIKAIEALLLGQARLGDGKAATEVPLNRPYTLLAGADGGLLVGESSMGRLRAVDADGLITTYLDARRGQVKRNLTGIRDLDRGSDGALYVTTASKVHRIQADGAVTVAHDAGPDFTLATMALGPDGTMFVGGHVTYGPGGEVPRIERIGPDGEAAVLPEFGQGFATIEALEVDADGTLWIVRTGATPEGNGLWRMASAGIPARVTFEVKADLYSDMARGPDGVRYVSAPREGKIYTIDANAVVRALPGPDESGGERLFKPAALDVAPDGTLYVSDVGTSLVHARRPDGQWRVVAGVSGALQDGDGRTLALNTPYAVAFDAEGRLLVVENGRHRVVRLEDGQIRTVAGSTEGYAGDTRPALEARFSGVTGIAVRGDDWFLIDAANGRIRQIDAAATVSTLVGTFDQAVKPTMTGRRPRLASRVDGAVAIAVDGLGRPYWSLVGAQQIQRLAPPEQIEHVAGRVPPPEEAPSLATLVGDVLADGEPAAATPLRYPLGLAFEPSGDLLVADAGHMQVRRIRGLAGPAPTIEAFAGRGAAALVELLGTPEVAMRSGDRREVDLVVPAGLAIDPAGNIYVGELGTGRLDLLADVFATSLGIAPGTIPPISPRIRKIAPDGQVTTIAGPGGKFFPDPEAEDALVMPAAIAIAPDGRMAIADPGANLVRILPAGSY